MKKEKRNNNITGVGLLILEAVLLLAVFSLLPGEAVAGIGNPNATVQTLLSIGNSAPDIINVSVNDDAASITLTPNTTTTVNCLAVIRDYNGENDINITNATFYGTTSSTLGSANDNNDHYFNNSCSLNNSFISYNGYNDDEYSTLANCTFQLEYYANPEIWRCEVFANDSADFSSGWYDDITVSQLLALLLPDNINYGTVNALEVSDENQTNVTNVGNVAVNISLEGYAVTQGDNYAMNCSYGSVQNISIEYEKYNLTASNPGVIDHGQMIANYTNLSSSPVVRTFNLTARQDDLVNDAIKPSYWRIYVPLGVAGNCTGNVIFGATTAAGT